jgi:hypothetical protein
VSPRKDHWSNGGAVGVEVTPRMVRYLLTAHRHKDSERARAELGVDRAALLSMVRYVERKTKRMLFIRRKGAGNTRMAPAPEALRFFDWCMTHPQGGVDWPH